MITFRQHVVTLVAVFLALAVGVVLGGGPLSELGREDQPAAATTDQGAAADDADGYGDAFAQATAGRLYRDGLDGHAVAVLTLPGADGDVVSALAEQVSAAGGQVAATYPVRTSVTDASQKSLVDTLGAQLATQLPGDLVDADAPTYVRLGQLLGVAVAPGSAKPADLGTVRESLAGADLMEAPADAKRADLVLVVLGDRCDPAILGGVTQGLADAVPGVVVAGGSAAAGPSGDLAALRSADDGGDVTTVDGVETPLGQVTTTLALVRALTTQGGAFGPAAGGAVPID